MFLQTPDLLQSEKNAEMEDEEEENSDSEAESSDGESDEEDEESKERQDPSRPKDETSEEKKVRLISLPQNKTGLISSVGSMVAPLTG